MELHGSQWRGSESFLVWVSSLVASTLRSIAVESACTKYVVGLVSGTHHFVRLLKNVLRKDQEQMSAVNLQYLNGTLTWDRLYPVTCIGFR